MKEPWTFDEEHARERIRHFSGKESERSRFFDDGCAKELLRVLKTSASSGHYMLREGMAAVSVGSGVVERAHLTRKT